MSMPLQCGSGEGGAKNAHAFTVRYSAVRFDPNILRLRPGAGGGSAPRLRRRDYTQTSFMILFWVVNCYQVPGTRYQPGTRVEPHPSAASATSAREQWITRRGEESIPTFS